MAQAAIIILSGPVRRGATWVYGFSGLNNRARQLALTLIFRLLKVFAINHESECLGPGLNDVSLLVWPVVTP
jgi:hypothetical protein